MPLHFWMLHFTKNASFITLTTLCYDKGKINTFKEGKMGDHFLPTTQSITKGEKYNLKKLVKKLISDLYGTAKALTQ